MKTKIRNIICSIVVAIALLLSSNFGLAFGAVNFIRNFASAEYKATDFKTPFEFTSDSGWNSTTNSKGSANEDAVVKAFENSKISIDLTTVETGYKPSTMYDGTLTSSGAENLNKIDTKVLKIEETNAPTSISVTKYDDDSNKVYQENPSYNSETDDETNKWVYQKTEGSDVDAHFSSIPSGEDKNDYVYFEADGDDPAYYKKRLVETETVNTTYGYQTSDKLSLAKNNWYVVSVWIYTANATASIVVSADNFNAKINNINTEESWKQYFLFIETSSDDVKDGNGNKATISIYYGNEESINKINETDQTGYVYIDSLKILTISKTDFNNMTINGSSEGIVSVETDPTNATAVRESARVKAELGFDGSFQYEDASLQSNIYDYMFGQSDYVKETANTIYQNYIQRYESDSSSTELSQKQLDIQYSAIAENLTVSIANEGTDFAYTVDNRDEDGNIVSTDTINPSTFNADNTALKIVNTSDSYALGLLSPSVTISQFGYYKLTLYVKGVKSSDQAIVKLVSSVTTAALETKGQPIVKAQTVDAFTESSDKTNNWVEVNFYIKGSSYEDTTMQIALLANTNSTVYFDDLRLEKITSIEGYKDSVSSKQFDLFPSSIAISKNITNGYFDLVKVESLDTDETNPYAPQSWDPLSDNSKDVVAGVVSSQDSKFNLVKDTIGAVNNPVDYLAGTTIAQPKTNVLAIYSQEQATFGYTNSSTFTLSTNSVYYITFEVRAGVSADSEFDGSMFARLVSNKKVLAEFSEEIPSSSEWTVYTIAVKTGNTSLSCKLELGVKDAIGTAFFQRVGYTKLSETTNDNGEKVTVNQKYQTRYQENNSIQSQMDNHIRFVDVDSNAMVMYNPVKAEGKEYYTSLAYSLKELDKDQENTQGEFGIIDTSVDNTAINATLTTDFLSTPAQNKLAMLILNSSDLNTTIVPNIVSSLASNSYYQIEMYVKTNTPEGKALRLKIDAIGVNLSINSSEYDNLPEADNGYKKVTIMVKTGSSKISSLNVVFDLGTETNKFTGLAVISGLEVTKLSNVDAYNEAVEGLDLEDNTTLVKDFTDTTESSTMDEDVNSNTLVIFFLVLSSILLVSALVFAIVSFYIKKRNNTAKASEYKSDNNTISKDGFV